MNKVILFLLVCALFISPCITQLYGSQAGYVFSNNEIMAGYSNISILAISVSQGYMAYLDVKGNVYSVDQSINNTVLLGNLNINSSSGPFTVYYYPTQYAIVVSPQITWFALDQGSPLSFKEITLPNGDIAGCTTPLMGFSQYILTNSGKAYQVLSNGSLSYAFASQTFGNVTFCSFDVAGTLYYSDSNSNLYKYNPNISTLIGTQPGTISYLVGSPSTPGVYISLMIDGVPCLYQYQSNVNFMYSVSVDIEIIYMGFNTTNMFIVQAGQNFNFGLPMISTPLIPDLSQSSYLDFTPVLNSESNFNSYFIIGFAGAQLTLATYSKENGVQYLYTTTFQGTSYGYLANYYQDSEYKALDSSVVKLLQYTDSNSETTNDIALTEGGFLYYFAANGWMMYPGTNGDFIDVALSSDNILYAASTENLFVYEDGIGFATVCSFEEIIKLSTDNSGNVYILAVYSYETSIPYISIYTNYECSNLDYPALNSEITAFSISTDSTVVVATYYAGSSQVLFFKQGSSEWQGFNTSDFDGVVFSEIVASPNGSIALMSFNNTNIYTANLVSNSAINVLSFDNGEIPYCIAFNEYNEILVGMATGNVLTYQNGWYNFYNSDSTTVPITAIQNYGLLKSSSSVSDLTWLSIVLGVFFGLCLIGGCIKIFNKNSKDLSSYWKDNSKPLLTSSPTPNTVVSSYSRNEPAYKGNYNSKKTFNITVINVTQSLQFFMKIEESDTVHEIKSKIKDLIGIPVTQISLSCNGIDMENEVKKTASKWGIREGGFIEMIIKGITVY